MNGARTMRPSHITRLLLALGVAAVVGTSGCGGGDSKKEQTTAGRSTTPAPSGDQKEKAGIPKSGSDQKEYFKRIYCVGDRPAQCKCKLEVMGANDSDTFGETLYKLKRADQATVLRFGRASTGCA